MSDQIPWPPIPDDLSSAPELLSGRSHAQLALFRAQLNEVAARRDAATTGPALDKQAVQAEVDVEDRRRDAFLSAYLAVAQATLDRMLKRAETLATIAATVATIYGAVLGLAFSLEKDRPLPIWGLVPAALLGGSLVLVAIYVGTSGHGVVREERLRPARVHERTKSDSTPSSTGSTRQVCRDPGP